MPDHSRLRKHSWLLSSWQQKIRSWRQKCVVEVAPIRLIWKQWDMNLSYLWELPSSDLLFSGGCHLLKSPEPPQTAGSKGSKHDLTEDNSGSTCNETVYLTSSKEMALKIWETISTWKSSLNEKCYCNLQICPVSWTRSWINVTLIMIFFHKYIPNQKDIHLL